MTNCKIKKSMVFATLFILIGITFSQTYGLRMNETPSNFLIHSNILFVGGSGPDNYTQIQEAIDAANDGDIIFVSRGVYYENIYIDKKIVLFGEDKDSTIIDGGRIVQESVTVNYNRNSDTVFIFSTESVYIADFSIRNGNSGINFENSTNNNIYECNIYSNNIGFGLNDSSYNLFLRCNIFKNLIYGIQMYNSSNNTIKNSNIFLNDDGLFLLYSIHNSFDYCNISNNGYKNIWLTNYSNNNEIINSNINKGHSGLVFETSSNNNLIYHNNFVSNNEYNGYDECENIWDSGNITGGNYWNDYNGTDDNGDGIGDTPYFIEGGVSQDRYPLMSPAFKYDIESPAVKISKPIKGLYILGLLIRRYLIRRPLIFGDLKIEANVTDNINNNFNLVEFYIDGKLKKIDTTPAYEYTLKRDRLRIFGHRHTICIIAFDQSGNRGFNTIKVWKFL